MLFLERVWLVLDPVACDTVNILDRVEWKGRGLRGLAVVRWRCFRKNRAFPWSWHRFPPSQASLIWQELEQEEEGVEEGPRGLFRPRLGRRRAARREDGVEGQVWRLLRQRIPHYSDDDCVRYFVLGTLAALLALLVNLLYRANWG